MLWEDRAHIVPPPNREEVCDKLNNQLECLRDGHLSSFMIQYVPSVPKGKPLQVFTEIHKKVNILHC